MLESYDESQQFNLELQSSFMPENVTSSKLFDAVKVIEENIVKAATSSGIETPRIDKGHVEQYKDEKGAETNKPIKTKRDKTTSPDKNTAEENAAISALTKNEDATEIEYVARHKARRNREQRRRNRLAREAMKKNQTLSPEEKLAFTIKETAVMPNVSNAVYYKNIPPEFLVEDPSTFLWDRPDLMIPEWMKDYFRWHRWKRSTWKDRKSANDTTANDWWKSERWLISQCLMSLDPKKCGGTADRLKPFQVLLRIAYENKRIYLIRWTRPAPLEEFLLPPVGGFDWRVPPDMAEIMEDRDNGKCLNPKNQILKYAATGLSLVRSRHQTSTPGVSYDEMVFNDTKSEMGADDDYDMFKHDAIFSRVWKVFFTPSKPVQAIIRSTLSDLHLIPNKYAGSHLRALYAKTERRTEQIQRFTENAIACGSMMFPGVPIFFASDSTIALEYAQTLNGQEIDDGAQRLNETKADDAGGKTRSKLRVVTAADASKSTIPLRLEKVVGNDTAAAKAISQPWHLDSLVGPVQNFYDTFVDIYLLAMAGCVTYNIGGFGHWAMLIGGQLHCGNRQHIIGRRARHPETDYCHFRAPTESFKRITNRFNKEHPSIFGRDDPDTGPLLLKPMK